MVNKGSCQWRGSAIWTAGAPVLVELNWSCTGRKEVEMVAHALKEGTTLVDEIERWRNPPPIEAHREAASATDSV